MQDAENSADNDPDHAASEPADERPIDGTFTNGRLRRKPRDGEPSVIQMGDMKLGRWGWVGGRLYVSDDEIRFAGLQLLPVGNVGPPRTILIDYAVAIPANGIESVERRRGVTGAAYVAVTATDGAELQLRCGPFGSKSDLVVETIQALIDG